ncbi:hypothetical protein E4K73_40345 [Streptomyces sp. IB201691-2A2]|nr:hypothetical protein E4K73_40345 [Streptomyces sp. IB201691-2A2]
MLFDPFSEVLAIQAGASRRNATPCCAPALFHLDLVHAYSRTPVERATAQIVRRMWKRNEGTARQRGMKARHCRHGMRAAPVGTRPSRA